MVEIRKEIDVRAEPARVYGLVKEAARFPGYASSVREVRVLTTSGGRTRSRWWAALGDAPVEWVQESLCDDAARLVTFCGTAGDFDRMEGEWQVRGDGGTARVQLHLCVELRLPTIDSLIEGVLRAKFEAYAADLLAGIKRAAEESLCL